MRSTATRANPSAHGLLVDAIRSELSGEPARLDVGGRRDAEWQAVLACAEWHRVTTVIDVRLAATPSVPVWVNAELVAARAQRIARRLLREQVECDVLRVLGGEGIAAMPLKGAALTAAILPTGVERDMSDLDLLVAEAELDRAHELLAKAGYRSARGVGPWRHRPELLDPTGALPVELHRHVVEDPRDAARWPPAELWAGAEECGGWVLPRKEDLLTHVCLHFLAGRSVRSEGALSQLRDVAWIMATSRLDWQAFEAAARRHGVFERVRAVVGTARELGLVRDGYPLLDDTADGRAAVRRFIVGRVLVDRPQVPLGDAGHDARATLWWARVHFADRPAGELTGRPDRNALVASRSVAAWRLARQLGADPTQALRDHRTGRWLAGLD